VNRIQQIKAAKNGSRDALVSLIMADQDDYYRLAYVLTGNPHDAGDALEDMIVVLFEKIHQLRDERAFAAWSRTILRNCCRQIQRSQQRTLPVEDVQLPVHTADLSLAIMENMVLRSSLEQLDSLHREVIRLRYYLDYDYQTIARMLGIPVGTVRSRLANGLKKLKTILGGEGFAEYGGTTR
jgi:RNA polymerase sigma factor (sigma-70 family)